MKNTGNPFVIRFAPGLADRLARLALAVASIATVTSCGSGAVGPSTIVNDPTQITIQPGQCTGVGATVTCTNPAILYSGLPTTFVITGGTGSYILSSNNQAVLPVSGNIVGNSVTLIPNPVLTDTNVILTARDTGTTPIATAQATVKPGTVSNNITITPTGTQASTCTPALCSGGDALVSATLSQGGIPLPARGVRFDVVTGDFRFVTTDPLTGIETLSSSVTVISDETGKVQARIRATANAANQTALLQVTDIGTGAFQRASFIISQSTGSSPGFFTTPATVTFQGTRLNQCAAFGVSAAVFVFGGVPPYTVSNTSSGFSVTPIVISSSGGNYSITPNGTCVTSTPIIVTDSSGHTATTTVSNIPGTQVLPALAVAPATVTLSSCTGSASFTVAGGTGGPYFQSSGSDALTTSISGNTVTITRRNPSPAVSSTGTATVDVGVSDGTTSASVTVNLTGQGAGACPAPGFAANPTTVTLNDCTGVTQVTLSGGSGTYSASSNNTGVTATVSGNILSIKRTNPSGVFTGSTVTATDGVSSVPIAVTGSGAGAGACSATPTAFAANPTSVALNACTDVGQVVLSGGSGIYSAASGNTSVTATVSGNLLSITRTSPSPSGTSTTVTANDGVSGIPIAVTVAGAALGSCP
jgi:hypothetical protein